MRLAAVVAGLRQEGVRPVFSGGTSLSKGFGLIRRFSEDLDFRMTLPAGGLSRAGRRAYRRRVVEALGASGQFTLADDAVEAGNESRYFSCLIGYRNLFLPNPALRPRLKLEMTFAAPVLPPEDRPLRSFVAEARGEEPEVAAIACVSPVETAADKLSALVWRVLTRRRGSEQDDPTLIRHLHDLALLEAHAGRHPGFPELLGRIMDGDADRGAAPAELRLMTSATRLARALDILTEDIEYRGEYDRFVLGMSWAAEGETLSFAEALDAAGRIGGCLSSDGAAGP